MKTISFPISGFDEAFVAHPPPAAAIPALSKNAVVPAIVQAVAHAVPTTSYIAAGQIFVTVALSINISANGLYASSRCTSPSRAGGAAVPAIDSGTHCGVAGAIVPLKLCLGEADSRSGFSCLLSSHPQTSQAGTAVDTSLMDLHHKLTSLSMTNNSQPEQHPAEVAHNNFHRHLHPLKKGLRKLSSILHHLMLLHKLFQYRQLEIKLTNRIVMETSNPTKSFLPPSIFMIWKLSYPSFTHATKKSQLRRKLELFPRSLQPQRPVLQSRSKKSNIILLLSILKRWCQSLRSIKPFRRNRWNPN